MLGWFRREQLPFLIVPFTGGQESVALAQCMLDSTGVWYRVRNERLQDLFGAGRLFTRYNYVVGPVEFVVHESDADFVRELLSVIENGPRPFRRVLQGYAYLALAIALYAIIRQFT